MTPHRHLLAAVALVATSACAGLPGARPSTPFADTKWQLHAIRSMSDAQGSTQVPEPHRYTLRFGADGRANLRLDCNRGSATWQATPASDHTGALTLGPIAATRALCPPPHLDERIIRDLAYVRSYRLIGGKLFLSLMADGGIYEWHPHSE